MTNTAIAKPVDIRNYQLDDRYRQSSGRVYLNGSQALVRLPMLQQELDKRNGLNTAGFISGYTGSPLGGYDIALKQAQSFLKEHHIHFQPGINEDMGATAVWGSQQVDVVGSEKYDGVFALWYGKGPGVDRAGDALKHGSYSGSAKNGGVLVLAGDDHGAKSSTIAHQSDQAFIHFAMPYLNPASVQDYLDFGLKGIALSRYSGCWVGMKCVTDTIESAASVSVDLDEFEIYLPPGPLPGELNTRVMVPPALAEVNHWRKRLPAVQAFVRANKLDRVIADGGSADGIKRLGIVTTGKAFLDVMQALEELGLDLKECEARGIGIYKVAMPWPLEPDNIRDFITGYPEIMVVEEKRPIIEDQLARLLVNAADKPLLIGKYDEQGAALISNDGELNPMSVARAIGARLQRLGALDDGRLAQLEQALQSISQPNSNLIRMPSFCAGCPHNTSTKVPDGSVAFGGIGCHGMATFLPERKTLTLYQMGGEGAAWIGMSPFTERKHIFQNLGDGTYYHSGMMAIRAAVAANINITYKILVNDAIAMTGGQEIEGKVRVDMLTRQLAAEGVGRIAVVGRDVDVYRKQYSAFAEGVTLHQRDTLDEVQKELRTWPGVSAIVYDQYCATELRRRRKRGKAEEPNRRIFINQRVCEGCGDCSVQSNCIAVEPVETAYGRKRKINQSVCNKDFSCVKGYCPSFLSIYGGTPKKRGLQAAGNGIDIHQLAAQLPVPQAADTGNPYSVLITGIGGTGVVTLGALLGMAAFLEGKGCSVLDVAGLAQRNGAVTSHIRIADDPGKLYATRISRADLIIGCDIVVAAGAEVMAKMAPGSTRAVINSCVAPTSAFASNPDLDLSSDQMIAAISRVIGEECAEFVKSSDLATALLGNEVAANMFLVGYTIQKGWLPVSLEAVERAIELNGVSVEMNRASLAWGRLAASDPDRVAAVAAPQGQTPKTAGPVVFEPENADALAKQRARELTDYQNAAYAQRYTRLVNKAADRLRALDINDNGLTLAVAKYFYKLMAYKDEYEVARLHSDKEFIKSLYEAFDGDFRIGIHLAPPALLGRDKNTGRYPKREFGPWILTVFKVLKRMKFLRGTKLDLFGYSAHRRTERKLIDEYENRMEKILADLTRQNYRTAVEIATLPEFIRGYDTVKEVSIEEAHKRGDELMSAFYNPKEIAARIDAVEV